MKKTVPKAFFVVFFKSDYYTILFHVNTWKENCKIIFIKGSFLNITET
jgi:hypothetical protein